MTTVNTLGGWADSSNSGLMFRNKIINGDMRIDQRNAGAAVGSNSFPVDRFANQVTYGTLAFQQRSIVSTDSNYESGAAPGGFKNSVKISVSASNSSPATTDRNSFQQTIEGLNHADLDWGLSTAKTITISFWCKASVTGIYSLAIQNYVPDMSYCTTYTVNAANTWEYKTVVIAGPTTGTWPTTNTSGITLRFGLGMGSQRIATSNNAWLSGDYRQATGALQFTAQANGSTLYLTGIQLEAGSQATPFEQRPIGIELSLCQRYFEKSYNIDTAPGTSTSNGRFAAFANGNATTAFDATSTIFYKQPKRNGTTATITFYNQTGTINSLTWSLTGTAGTSFTPSVNVSSDLGMEITGTTTGLVAGTVYKIYGHYTVSSEL